MMKGLALAIIVFKMQSAAAVRVSGVTCPCEALTWLAARAPATLLPGAALQILESYSTDGGQSVVNLTLRLMFDTVTGSAVSSGDTQESLGCVKLLPRHPHSLMPPCILDPPTPPSARRSL